MTGIGLSINDDDGIGQVIPPEPITFGPWTAPAETTMTIADGRVTLVSTADGVNPRASRQVFGLERSTTYSVTLNVYDYLTSKTKYVRASVEPLLTTFAYGQFVESSERQLVFNVTTTADDQPMYIGMAVGITLAGEGASISEIISMVKVDG